MEQIERFGKRLDNLRKALTALEEAVQRYSQINSSDYWYVAARDSVVQSFEFTMDLLWKSYKDYLEIIEGIETKGSPKAVFKDCIEAQIITQSEFEFLVELMDYRNLTSHTYEELLAKELTDYIKDTLPALRALVGEFLIANNR